MTAKEYLGQAYRLDRQAAMLLAKADKLRKSLYGRGVSYDGDKVKGGSGVDLGDVIDKVIEYEKQADEKIDKLVAKRLEIEAVIASVPDEVQREVLERRYLLYQPWDSYYDKHTGIYIKGIYESMNYSRRQIFNLHGQALNSIAPHCIELH